MIRRADITVADELGTPEPGVYITVKDDTGVVATIYDDSGNLMANPFTSGLGGAFAYNISDTDAGTYTEEYRLSLSEGPRKTISVDLSIAGAASVRLATTRTALAALTTATPGLLTEAGREGSFVWSSANLQTQVTADTAQGIYVPPTGGNGSTGAWVRKFSGPLDARWFGLSASATGAANKTAWDAAVAYHIFSGIPLELPAGTFNVTGAPRVDANYFNIEGSNWGKTIFKPTSATEGIILTGRYGKLARIGFDGSVAGTVGIVARNCELGVIEECTVRNFDNDGLLPDPTYGGGAQGNNDGLRVVGGEYVANGGCGVRMTIAADNNVIGFYGVNATGNGSHGFLVRGHGGYIDPICIAQANGGRGVSIGEDGDGTSVEGWIIDAPYLEDNALGGIYGSAVSANNLINLKAITGIQGYSRHAAAFNSVGVITSGLTRFASNDGVGFVQASGDANNVYLLAAHNAGGNTTLNIGGAGTGIVKSSTAVSATSELKVTGATGTARYLKWQTSGADAAYIALGGSNVDLFYSVPATGSHAFEINATTVATVQADGFHVIGVGAFSGALTAASVAATGVYKVGANQVVGARDTGWTADTGTAKKTATATYAVGSALTVGAAYVQAEHTAIITRQALMEAALRDATQEIKALKDLVLAHGLAGA